jgi:hypothetical protein
MIRKLSIILVIVLLAFTAACSSSSSTMNSASGAGSNVAASATPGTCPTENTKSFAKTKFVADVALAGGAFKRYIYSPAKAGQFKKGANGKTLALVKAAAAGAFTVNRLDAAKNAAEANPTLCKLIVAPVAKFSASVSGLVGQAKSGSIDPSDVTSGNDFLDELHGAASQGGAAFTDNTTGGCCGRSSRRSRRAPSLQDPALLAPVRHRPVRHRPALDRLVLQRPGCRGRARR